MTAHAAVLVIVVCAVAIVYTVLHELQSACWGTCL